VPYYKKAPPFKRGQGLMPKYPATPLKRVPPLIVKGLAFLLKGLAFLLKGGLGGGMLMAEP
jgi:hypothetical protein